ncbi:hypothetical protein DM02DRAFT_683396 [Periconia macrospinosa]|uniref:Uncharacterized protein n=1 Tax=Periconia macrospinosa TaxID=97972 RepID=A0A2V1DIR2_9PLEO|nr:hypothetical protein DM02DRAFT_683396 [Periconia macrospinosa]
MTNIAAVVQDTDVTERYTYGELRLSRLNFYSKIFLRKLYFRRRHAQYGSYFAHFFAPLLFAFGLTSVVLSAMQVITASNTLLASDSSLRSFWLFCSSFSFLAIGFSLLVSYRRFSCCCFCIDLSTDGTLLLRAELRGLYLEE